MSGLFKGRADDHALLRLVREPNAPVNGRAVQKILHVEVQHPLRPLVAEGQMIPLAGDGHVARRRGLRQAGLAHGEGAHGAFGLLPALLKVQQGDGVQPHVAVVIDGQRHGEAAVVDEIVVPFLDAHGAGLDVLAAVDGQELFAVAGLAQIAVFVQQRTCVRDLVLHNGSPFVFFHDTILI